MMTLPRNMAVVVAAAALCPALAVHLHHIQRQDLLLSSSNNNTRLVLVLLSTDMVIRLLPNGHKQHLVQLLLQ
jgi:hypothetical protein